LEVVISKLIDDGGTWQTATIDLVDKTLHKGSKYTREVKEAAVKIINLLRVFAPRASSDNKVHRHVLAVGPFCRLATVLLRALGYKEFAKKLCPISSAGKQQALPVGSTGLCEILCAEAQGHFDAMDNNNKIWSLTTYAARQDISDMIFRSFFDMRVVHSQCQKFGLKFADR